MTEREYYNFLKDNLAIDMEVQCQLDTALILSNDYTGIIVDIDWPWVYLERDNSALDEDYSEWAVILTLSNCKYILPSEIFEEELDEDDWDININIPDEFPVRLEKE